MMIRIFPGFKILLPPRVLKPLHSRRMTLSVSGMLLPRDLSSDRNFNPKDKASRSAFEESKGRPKLTCPPSQCASEKYRDLLELDPLVKSEAGNKKVLGLPFPFFKKPQIAFSEIPLFAITEHHAKLCIANLAAMAQVCKGIQEHFGWIIDSMDKKVDLSSYVGTSPGEHTPADPQPHNITIREKLIDDLSNPESSVLIDTLICTRDAMELLNNGLFSSM